MIAPGWLGSQGRFAVAVCSFSLSVPSVRSIGVVLRIAAGSAHGLGVQRASRVMLRIRRWVSLGLSGSRGPANGGFPEHPTLCGRATSRNEADRAAGYVNPVRKSWYGLTRFPDNQDAPLADRLCPRLHRRGDARPAARRAPGGRLRTRLRGDGGRCGRTPYPRRRLRSPPRRRHARRLAARPAWDGLSRT